LKADLRDVVLEARYVKSILKNEDSLRNMPPFIDQRIFENLQTKIDEETTVRDVGFTNAS
jgi:hypothetical protein